MVRRKGTRGTTMKMMEVVAMVLMLMMMPMRRMTIKACGTGWWTGRFWLNWATVLACLPVHPYA